MKYFKSYKCKVNAFQIQKILLKDEFTEEDIVEPGHLVNKYLQLVDDHAPELKRKVKTHLLFHLVMIALFKLKFSSLCINTDWSMGVCHYVLKVDDIRRHGPPKGYTEDGFEKSMLLYAMIFFTRIRNTAISFLHMTLLNHVISGGYFPVNNDC